MTSILHCSQYYPYAGKTDPCDGNVHELTIQWQKAGGRPVPTEPEGGIQVCDAHMLSFRELGQRSNWKYSITEDFIVGVIDSTPEGQPLKKERE